MFPVRLVFHGRLQCKKNRRCYVVGHADNAGQTDLAVLYHIVVYCVDRSDI